MLTPEAILRSVEAIPSMPEVAHRVLKIIREDHDIDRLIDAVELDPGLTGLLLRTVNSSSVAPRTPVVSVRHALVMLGVRRIVCLVLGMCVGRFFTALEGGYVVKDRGLWDHSVGVAVASEHVAGRCSDAPGDLAFTAGLLHDLGKIALNALVEENLAEMLGRMDGRTFLEVEREILGTDHAAVGRLIAEAWKLPEPLILAIAHHHEPEGTPEGPARTLARIVHVADFLALSGGIGIGAGGLAVAVCEESAEALGLTSPERMHLETITIAEQYAETRALFDE